VALLGALLIGLLLAFVALDGDAPAQDAGSELQRKVEELGEIQERRGELAGTIDEQNAEINELIGEVVALSERVDAVRAELAARQAQLDRTTAELNRERLRLRQTRARLERALAALEQLLVAIYKGDEPDVLSLIVRSSSWADLITRTEYLQRIQEYDELVVARVRDLREEVEEIVARLADARERLEQARDEIAARERELSGARDRMQARKTELVAARDARAELLDSLLARQKEIEGDLSAIGAPIPGQAATLVGGRAIPPPNAPLVVRAVIEAANRIADAPYAWGGGHGSWESAGYDCSGAISYALHGGGLLDSSLDSGGLAFWGEPGVGSWITVLAHSGHAYAVIAGLRWDTSGGAGPRWHTDMRSAAGYVARHPAGY
jgi:peptidoglycan hydrolase CwlO-like protein